MSTYLKWSAQKTKNKNKWHKSRKELASFRTCRAKPQNDNPLGLHLFLLPFWDVRFQSSTKMQNRWCGMLQRVSISVVMPIDFLSSNYWVCTLESDVRIFKEDNSCIQFKALEAFKIWNWTPWHIKVMWAKENLYRVKIVGIPPLKKIQTGL